MASASHRGVSITPWQSIAHVKAMLCYTMICHAALESIAQDFLCLKSETVVDVFILFRPAFHSYIHGTAEGLGWLHAVSSYGRSSLLGVVGRGVGFTPFVG
jgi:hypothetical protein